MQQTSASPACAKVRRGRQVRALAEPSRHNAGGKQSFLLLFSKKEGFAFLFITILIRSCISPAQRPGPEPASGEISHRFTRPSLDCAEDVELSWSQASCRRRLAFISVPGIERLHGHCLSGARGRRSPWPTGTRFSWRCSKTDTAGVTETDAVHGEVPAGQPAFLRNDRAHRGGVARRICARRMSCVADFRTIMRARSAGRAVLTHGRWDAEICYIRPDGSADVGACRRHRLPARCRMAGRCACSPWSSDITGGPRGRRAAARERGVPAPEHGSRPHRHLPALFRELGPDRMRPGRARPARAPRRGCAGHERGLDQHDPAR